MLRHLKHIGHSDHTILFPRTSPTLHAMVSSCGFQRVKSSYDWHGLHRGKAEFVLFQYTLNGKGMLEYEQERHEVLPGSAMLLHFPHSNRYWLPAGWKPWEFVYVCLHGREIVHQWRSLELRKGPLVQIRNSSEVLGCAMRIVRLVKQSKLTSPFFASSLAYQLLMLLMRELSPASVTVESKGKFHKVIEYCRAHLDEPLGVEEMANIAGYSRFHFTRMFRQCEGVSPIEFLTSLRTRKAARLLQETGLSVKEISLLCGFRDTNYFCRVFRKTFSTSPMGFRKSGMYGGNEKGRNPS